VTGKRTLYKLKDFKKVYVRLEDDKGAIAAAPVAGGDAAAATGKAAELR
jgi:hypothetical protein